MAINEPKAVSSEVFMFENPACGIDVDVSHSMPGYTQTTVKVYKNDQPSKRFAFMAGRGLVRLRNSEKAEVEDILGQLLSLTDADEDIITFIRENGYLLPIVVEPGEYQEIKFDSLKKVVGRIRATVHLMSQVGSVQKDYHAIAGLILYLLFDDDIEIQGPDGSIMYRSCKHPFAEKFKGVSMLPEVDGEIEANRYGYFNIPDTIYCENYRFASDEYIDIIDGGYSNNYPGISDIRYHDIVYMYRNALAENEEIRLAIDFLFHFMHEVCVVEDVNSEGQYLPYSSINENGFTDAMQDAALRLAKIVINEEVNSNLSGIKPYYDVGRMEPSWKAESLLSSIYFSIFYLRPGIEIYKKCANPNCGLSFLVKTTSTKRKYCSPECSNAMAQRNFRRRKKLNDTENAPSE